MKKSNTTFVWWNLLLALVGEQWTDEVAKVNTVITGLEWKCGKGQDDNFALWHSNGANGNDILDLSKCGFKDVLGKLFPASATSSPYNQAG